MRVFKFCNLEFGRDNLKRHRLKISTLSDLNDPFEFRGFKVKGKASRLTWDRTRSSLLSNKGIICFSRDWSDPVLWSHYADSHRGLALGFDIPDDLLVGVDYRKKRKNYGDISSLSKNEKEALILSSLATKYKRWEYENEVRVFVSIETKDPETKLFFKNFDEKLVLKEIVIGPLAKVSSHELRKACGQPDIKVTTSRLAFTKYGVVSQENPKFWK
ncbi:DUF2971 domain-containing protein [Tropicimonas sp. TH_r6]|uniref:DUF2971 domain-containing protein n=1 Tax=Tropicimonas sp. TH_r6 TaxID=3082085 RepID=UPI002955DBD5|nr:DUF2971 domain-containing protein [Tropicimonas sp. TH_r6]MDV7141946.1 DUF2971 domain-containing protein [Tropicimonas sp. TH_r6]